MRDQGSQMNMLGLIPKIIPKFKTVTSGDCTVQNLRVFNASMHKVKLNFSVSFPKTTYFICISFSSLPVFQVINCHKVNSCIYIYIYIYIYSH